MSASKKTPKSKKLAILAYGFDKAGFNEPQAHVENADYVLSFLPYLSETSMDNFDGIIIPSGIFEEFYYTDNYLHGRITNLRFNQNLLAAREKQLFNALKRGAWVIFLLRSINNGNGQWTDTDLAKRVLPVFSTSITHIEPSPHVTCKSDEFRGFLDRFGIAQTKFWIGTESGVKILATLGSDSVAFENNGRYFFLPFFTTKTTAVEARDAATLITDAVLAYKLKHDIYLPPWLDVIGFKTEAQLLTEIKATETKLINLHDEVEKWKRYKAILSTSGDNLNEIVVEILRNFFSLCINSDEKFVEDAIILDDDGSSRFVVEIKGVNGGLKRDHVNQVDSHRERLGVGVEVPGLLVINDFMDLEGIEARKVKSFDASHLSHAKTINVRILRAVSLFEIMLALEESQERKAAFLKLCDEAVPLIQLPVAPEA